MIHHIEHKGRTIPIRIPEKMGYATNYIHRNNAFYEEEMLEYLSSFYTASGVILDIGANIGNHTMYFAEFLEAEAIHSFEPHPVTFQLLEENTKQYSHVTRYSVALGETEKMVAMQVPKGYLEQAYIYTGTDIVNDEDIADEDDIADGIKMVTLDSFGFTNVTLMKIDVEGHEMQVLQGGMQTVERCKPGHIFLEAHNVDLLFALIKCLQPFGYVIANAFDRVTYHFRRDE